MLKGAFLALAMLQPAQAQGLAFFLLLMLLMPLMPASSCRRHRAVTARRTTLLPGARVVHRR